MELHMRRNRLHAGKATEDVEGVTGVQVIDCTLMVDFKRMILYLYHVSSLLVSFSEGGTLVLRTATCVLARY